MSVAPGFIEGQQRNGFREGINAELRQHNTAALDGGEVQLVGLNGKRSCQ